MNNRRIPNEAIRGLKTIEELLGGILAAVYLYGSAVMDGLQKDSDVDILAVTDRDLSERTRKLLIHRLMLISGKIGNINALKPLEVTVINRNDVVPWRYPPKNEFIYGEWLREQFEAGEISRPAYDPDLTILITQLRENSINLFGPPATEMFEPIPAADIRTAIKDSLPGLIAGIKGDERNVILTLARMWLTITTGEIGSKGSAAQWAIHKLPVEYATLVDKARMAYLGEYVDKWEGMESEVFELVKFVKSYIK